MTRAKIIGLAGPAGSGKSTVAKILRNRHAFIEMCFADPIRSFIGYVLGWTEDELQAKKEDVLPGYGVSPRFMMQTLGTEWGREIIHPDFWVMLLERRISRTSGNFAGIVVSDCRFTNEADWIRAHGELWHLTRKGTEVQSHISEAGVPLTDRDQILDNDCDLDELSNRIALLLGAPA